MNQNYFNMLSKKNNNNENNSSIIYAFLKVWERPPSLMPSRNFFLLKANSTHFNIPQQQQHK